MKILPSSPFAPALEANITYIATAFKLKFPSESPLLERQEMCFNAVLQDCLDERWERIREVRDSIFGLRDREGCSLLFALLPRAKTATIALILKRNFGEMLASGDFSEVLPAVVRQGNPSLVALFWEYVSQNQKNYEGKPPLHLAIETGNRALVATFKANGAYLKATYRMGHIELTPLAWAIATGQMECFDELVQEGKTEWSDFSQGIGNLLHVAIYFDCPLSLEHLLIQYKDFIQPLLEDQNEKRQTPFLFAAARGDCEAMCLLKQAKADLTARDDLERTALHLAALEGQRQAVELLIYFGFKTDVRDNQKKRPQDVAANQPLREFLANLSDQQQVKAPLFAYRPPQNLVIGNGDIYGIASAAALETLQTKGVLDDLVRIIGIGSGVIGATFCALGNFHPLRKLVLETLFGCSVETFQKIDLRFLQTEDPSSLRKRLLASSGLLQGATFRQWIEEHIARETNIENCTFGEFAKKMGLRSRFKHLHLFAIEKGTEKTVHFSSEDPACDSFIMSDAIQIAFSLAGIFQPHSLFRKKNGKREIVENKGPFFAGISTEFYPHSLSLKFLSTATPESVFQLFDNPLHTLLIDPTSDSNKVEETVTRFLLKGANLSGFLLPALKEKGLLHIREPLIYFAGRTTALERLKNSLLPKKDWSSKSAVPLFSICGPAGSGKSELACQFAHLHESAFSHIFWIHAKTDETLHQSYCVLAETLRIFDRLDPPDEVQRKVLRKLEDNQFGKPWLLILDQVQKKLELPSQGGAILGTSPEPLGWDSEQFYALPVLTNQEAVDLLKRITKQNDEKGVLLLARTLGCFPLALTQAASYISQTGIPIEEYLQELLENPELLLVAVGSGRYQNSLKESCAPILANIHNIIEEPQETKKEEPPTEGPPKVKQKPKTDPDCVLL